MATNTDEREEIKPVAPTEQTKWRDPSLVGKYMVDPKTGLAGLFRSPDNGETWVLTDTVYGHVYSQDEVDNIWDNGAGHKVADEIKSATADLPNVRKQADEAVKFAESAIAASKVNSDAIVAQSSAVVEAKSAMDSATAEIQQLKANAASDVARIKADVASVQNEVDTAKAANSASVDQLKSDIGIAKKDLAAVSDSLTKAQAAVEQNHKALSDSVAAINSDIASTNDQLKAAQSAASDARAQLQSNVDTIKFSVDSNVASIASVSKQLDSAQASAATAHKALESDVAGIKTDVASNADQIKAAQAANDNTAKSLATYAQQAADQGKTIKTLEDAQNGFKETIADVQGNVSQVSDNVDKLQAGLTDTNKSVATVTAKADSLSATLTGQAKSIANITATATSLQATLKDAQGRISKVEQTAGEQSSLLSDLQGDLTKVSQKADSLSATLADAQKNITQIQADAKGAKEQITDLQGNVSTLQTSVSGMQATIASHDQTIHTLQVTASSLDSAIKDAKGNLSTLQQRADSLSTQLTNVAGQVNTVKATADSNTATISTINKNAMQDRGAVTDTKTSFDSLTQLGTYSIKAVGLPNMPEAHYGTLIVSGSTGSGWLSQQFVADNTGNVYTRIFANNAWSAWKQGGTQEAINQVKQTADSNTATISNLRGTTSQLKQTLDSTTSTLTNAQKDISQLQQTANGFNSKLADHDKNIATLQADSKSLTSDMSDAKGRLSKVEQTASAQSTTIEDVQGDLSQVKQTATSLVQTMKDAQGNISTLQQKADSVSDQLASAQGDIASLQTDVTGIKATLVSHEGDIHTLQADSKTLKDDMADAKGNISSLQKTSTSLVSEFRDHDGRLSKVEQTATEHTSELADAKGNLDKVTQKADSLEATLTDAQKDINSIKVDASGIHEALTGQGKQITTINATLDGLNTKYEGVSDDLSKLSGTVATNSTQIDQNKKSIALKADQSTVNNLSGEVSQAQAQLKVQADQISSKVSSTDFKTLNDKVNGMQIGGRNLVTGTAEPYTMCDAIPDTTWQNSYACEALPVTVNGYEILPKGDGYHATLIPGKEYTQTIWIETDARIAKNGLEFTWYTDVGHDEQPANIVKIANNSYKLVSTYTWPGKTYNNVRLFDTFYLTEAFDLSTGTYLKFGKLKLEEGNVSTDWTPAPEDTIAAIQKNTTAIDQADQKISLKADQIEVDQIKNTASQNSSRLDVMANEISSKVTSTDVNNIVDSKGYATTSTVQSLITQKAGTINENITNLDAKYSAKDGINLQRGTGDCSFNIAMYNATVTIENYDDRTKMFHVKGSSGFYTGYNADTSFVPTVGEIYTVSADVKGVGTTSGDFFKYEGADSCSLGTVTLTNNWQRISNTVHIGSVSGQWIFYLNNNAGDFYVKHIKIERGSVATPWTPAPIDNATVTQVQQITASIDGIQSTVANKADKSQITQLSNLVQSKVSSSDFNNLRKAVDLQTLDSADINSMKTNGHYFVHNLANNPVGGWVYVDITGNGTDRIRQDVYQDIGNQHKYRRWFGTYWTGWEEGATYTEITQLQDAINLRVQKGELLSQINLTAGNTLIQSNKLYLDASSVVITGTAFIPSAAIASLSADKINTGCLNTNNVSLGDGRTRIRADHDYMYIQPTGSAASNTGIRMGYSGLDFLTNVIPNGYSSSVPYYSVGYDGAANGYFKISAFDHINPGGATATQNWFSMVDAISLTNSEINFATKGNMHMQVVDGGVNIKPTLFFQNNTNNGTWAGFTRGDNSDIVEFSTGDNNGENFRIDCGARFMQYVYINGYARAQGWLTNSTLSKKTNIRKLDQQIALDKIRQDDQYLYEYKRNIEQGIYDPQASFIIDDVNDVSHYSVPREFIDQSGNYREPNVELAYLIAAFQAIDKQVQTQKEEIKELKEKLQHE